MKPFLTTWLCLLLGVAVAQPKINLDEIRGKFPNAPAVVYNEEILNLDVVADQLVASREYVTRYVVLDDKAIGLGEKTVTYIPGFFELSKFEATTYVPNGRSYKKLKVDQWEDKNRINYMFFFDDVKYRHFVFPGVQKGAILEVKYTYNQLDPTMQFPFLFQESVPLIKGSFTLHYTDKVKPYVKFFGDSIATQFSQLGDGKYSVNTWSIENYPEWKGFSHAPSHQYNLPHAFPMIKEYKTDTKGWQSGLNTTKQLYAHNSNFIKDLNKDAPIPELKSLVDSLKSVSKTQEDLTRNIYYWVQDHVRYIAFEDGLGGFVPRQANDIFRKRYGDCKDMSSLITFMCGTAGIPAHVTWIGTRDLPYSYSDLPLPNSDNHMIAAVYMKNKWQFLDATARFLRYGTPSGFIQGKEALIAISPDSFQVVKVPVMPAAANIRKDSSHLTLEKDLIKGDIRLTLDGYHKFDLMENIKLTKSDKIDETMQHSLMRGSNKCRISQVTYKDLEDRDKPMVVSAKIELPDYAKLIDNSVYVNLHLDKSIAGLKIDTTGRNVAREFDFTFDDKRVVSLEIPSGYEVSKLPANLEFKKDKYSFTLRYSKEGSRVIYRFTTQINQLMLPKEDFKEWNKCIDQLNQAFKEVVVLEKL